MSRLIGFVLICSIMGGTLYTGSCFDINYFVDKATDNPVGKTAKYILLQLFRLLRDNPITRFAIDQVNNLKRYITDTPLLSYRKADPENYNKLHSQMERDLESLNLIKYNNLVDSSCSELSQTSADIIAREIYTQVRETPLILRNIEELICCICDHIKVKNIDSNADIVKAMVQSCILYE